MTSASLFRQWGQRANGLKVSSDDRGYVELFDILSGAEEGPGGVLPDDGPPCGGTIVFRGHYGGSSTSSGTWSNGDAIAEATID